MAWVGFTDNKRGLMGQVWVLEASRAGSVGDQPLVTVLPISSVLVPIDRMDLEEPPGHQHQGLVTSEPPLSLPGAAGLPGQAGGQAETRTGRVRTRWPTLES